MGSMHSSYVLAVCNQKGGVGKTTTTFHLARAGLRAGLRVLIVDADPQGNLTASSTLDRVDDNQVGLADVLSEKTDITISDVIVAGVWPGLDVVPTPGDGKTLGDVRDELVIGGLGRERRLSEPLEAVWGDYDLILIDCAPSLDLLTVNAFTAAHGALIVTHSKQWALSGLANLLESIEQVRQYTNPHIRVAGIIVNQHEDRTLSGKQWTAELHGAARERDVRILEPMIPKRVVIADAAEAARGLDEYGTSEARELAKSYDTYISTLVGGFQ